MNQHDVGAALELTGSAIRLLGKGVNAARVQRSRRDYTARELYEAADLAAQGVPRPGSPAVLEIQHAERSGDFERARALRAEVRELAPPLRRMARAAEKSERRAKRGKA